jgi:hypothetical protein
MAEIYSGPWVPYSEYIKRQAAGEIKLVADSVKMCLVTSSYTPDINTHVSYSEVSTYEPTVSGYNAGGEVVTGRNLVKRDGTTTWTADIVSFGPFLDPLIARYGILYNDTHSEKILISYCLLDANGVDFSTSRFYMMFQEGLLNFNRG